MPPFDLQAPRPLDQLEIAGLVLSQGARMAGLGVTVGLVLVFAVTRFISSLLFGVAPTDPMTLAGVAALIFALALVAAYVPARRAVTRESYGSAC